MNSHPRIAGRFASLFVATLLIFIGCTSAVVLPPVNITVLGFESSMVTVPPGEPEIIAEPYDAIVVGGGLSGMTAAWYLRDRKVICLERETTAGGLAFRGTTPEGVIYGRGAAYYSQPRARAKKIYEELGLDPIEKTAIPEPIDNYFWKGKLYEHVWSDHTVKDLPKGFADFKKALLEAEKNGWVAEQPMEKAKDMRLDKITAAEFIKPFGPELKTFLDSYSQSALGGRTEDVNAMAFANFYLAEIETRYAWPGGTAGAAVHMVAKLEAHNKAMLRTGAAVTKVKNVEGGVEVTWVEGGKLRRAKAKAAIMAVPLKSAAWIVEDFPADRKALVDKLPYADYVLHNVFTSKELYTSAYDTWLADGRVSDIITARWIETKGFKEKAKAGPGILTLYQPMAPFRKESLSDPEHVKRMALECLKEATPLVPALLKEPSLKVESYRWPASIHIVPTNFFSEWVPKLKEPVGHVHFAGNNLGTPSFEESFYRGWLAAMAVEKLFKGVQAPPQK